MYDTTPTKSLTVAQRLNVSAGKKVFADTLDIYGRPLDGWAIPTISSREKDGQIVSLTLGTFRMTANDYLASVSRDVNVDDLAAASSREAYIATIYDELFKKLVHTLINLKE